MIRKFVPAFGCMTAMLLLAACGSKPAEAPAAPVNPNAALGDAEMASDDGTLPSPEAASETAPDAGVGEGAAAAPSAAPAAAAAAPAAGAVIVAGFTGDAAAGKKLFNQCGACHTVKEGQNRVGPSLYGIIGEKAGEVPNFKFSKAMLASGITWTEDNLFKYLEKPSAMVPGTTMAFAGIPDGQKRADVVAYIAADGQVN